MLENHGDQSTFLEPGLGLHLVGDGPPRAGKDFRVGCIVGDGRTLGVLTLGGIDGRLSGTN